MKIYIGQTRSRTLIAELSALGWGECVSRGELPPRRSPWFHDNGAFVDLRAGRDLFDADAYRHDLEKIASMSDKPDFLVAPDIVTGGLDSLRMSLEWVDQLTPIAPVYLAVQDGMEPIHVAPVLPRFAGLFVGGDLDWKLLTGGRWVHLAHAFEKRCHIGRVGVPKRVRWAQSIGADSVDSALPLWSRENLKRFKSAAITYQWGLIS